MTNLKMTPESVMTLPTVGQSRWNQIKPFLPVSRETWRKMCRDGRAPKPVQLSERCTVWNNAEILRWIDDPAGYRA